MLANGISATNTYIATGYHLLCPDLNQSELIIKKEWEDPEEFKNLERVHTLHPMLCICFCLEHKYKNKKAKPIKIVRFVDWLV